MFCLKKIVPPKFIAKIADHLPLDDVVADTNQTSKYVEILRAQELSWHRFLKYCCESYHAMGEIARQKPEEPCCHLTQSIYKCAYLVL